MQVDARCTQPHLAALYLSATEVDGAVGAEDAILHAVEDGQVALHDRQFELVEGPACLTGPVLPVARAVQVVVAQVGLEYQRSRRQRGAARLEPHNVLGAIALGGEVDVRHVELRQPGLLVQPAQVTADQVDAPLGQQPVQERIVLRAGLLCFHRHTGNQQLAFGGAPDQHIGTVGRQADELQRHRRHRLPRQFAVERPGGQQHALLRVHRAYVAGAERRMPAIPIGVEFANSEARGERGRPLVFEPFARGVGLRPEHEADQQHGDDRQCEQRRHDAHDHPPESRPDWMADGGPQSEPEPAQRGADERRRPAASARCGHRTPGSNGKRGLVFATRAWRCGTVVWSGRAAGHGQIIRQY